MVTHLNDVLMRAPLVTGQGNEWAVPHSDRWEVVKKDADERKVQSDTLISAPRLLTVILSSHPIHLRSQFNWSHKKWL